MVVNSGVLEVCKMLYYVILIVIQLISNVFDNIFSKLHIISLEKDEKDRF